MTDYQLTQKVIGCAMKVHSALGPGLLESAYRECLYFELCGAGLFVEKEKPMPVVYSNVKLEHASSAKTSAPSAVNLR
ncbi:MAG: hypothetical protein AUJ04_02190 [Acidobacteria bacterium 13_1_40CM_3_55_6]|nr:MAG: hypothetical protein AUJ04_02190 [Acidobacteria bacterium 13_1_40CM_3_55_6]